jgi:hypothetical protein
MVKSTLTLICGAGGYIGRNLVNRPKNDGFWGLDQKFANSWKTL